MKTTNLNSLLCTAGLLLMATKSPAQNFALDWFTIDGGGGTSTGGSCFLAGTIGQPDAGAVSGGSYSLNGGFWSAIAITDAPGAPFLSIERFGGEVRVFWTIVASDWRLEHSPSVTGTWFPVAPPYATNATDISVSVSPSAGHRFYRLRRQ